MLWTEWNGKYRDAIRRFWRADINTMSELATRLCGSSDLYEHNGRKPYASINFVTSHDGFSLHDLVSYNHKHNEANQSNNSDGDSHNLSWNCGTEGPTDDARILRLREQQKKNFIATLILSQGVPMIRSGDEISHSQFGNNNAYCQDNEISWLNWNLSPEQQKFFSFVCKVIRLWRQHPVFQRRQFFQGREIRGETVTDIAWFTPAGPEMTDADWHSQEIQCLGMRLDGEMINEFDEYGQIIAGRTVLMVLNEQHHDILFKMPPEPPDTHWEPILDTGRIRIHQKRVSPHMSYKVVGHSLVLFQLNSGSS